jgi:hypothetical protein
MGAAVCENCGTPLTAYGGQITGEVSTETRLKASRLAARPVIVPVMAGLDVLFAVFGPLAMVMGRFIGRTAVNTEGTNYLGAAFGAVGVAFVAMFMVPFAIALLVVAWGTIAQRSWAWPANILVLAALVFLGGLFLPLGTVGWVIRILLAAVLGFMWSREETRAWLGA